MSAWAKDCARWQRTALWGFVTLLLDTCAPLLWTLDPQQLSKKAAAAVAKATESGQLVVSSISFWEIGLKSKCKQIRLGTTLRDYTQRVQALGTVEITPVELEVWLLTATLDWAHRDPVDRVIVATAQQRGSSIVTKDEAMRGFYKRCVW